MNSMLPLLLPILLAYILTYFHSYSHRDTEDEDSEGEGEKHKTTKVNGITWRIGLTLISGPKIPTDVI